MSAGSRVIVRDERKPGGRPVYLTRLTGTGDEWSTVHGEAMTFDDEAHARHEVETKGAGWTATMSAEATLCVEVES